MMRKEAQDELEFYRKEMEQKIGVLKVRTAPTQALLAARSSGADEPLKHIPTLALFSSLLPLEDIGKLLLL